MPDETAPKPDALTFLLDLTLTPVLVSDPDPSPPSVPTPEVAPLPAAPVPTVAVAPPTALAFIQTQRTPDDDATWHPSPPPALDGIDEIILNFETTGVDWERGAQAIGVTVGTLDGQLMQFLPFRFRGQNLDEAVVKRWAARELRGKQITNANTRFDLHIARTWGVDLTEQDNTFSDVQHYAALLDDHRKRFGLDTLAEEFLGGVEVPRVDESMMAHFEAQQVVDRAVYQVKLVAQLRDEFWWPMEEQGLQRVRALEDAVIPVVVEMEKNAAKLDLGLLAQYTVEARTEYEQLLDRISRESGITFDDTTASWERLFAKCSLTPAKLKNGKSTFKDETLAPIDHPLIKLARYAAQLDSLRSKIFKPYSEHVTPEGILHFALHQLRSDEGGTVSGRLSAPYIQQAPNADNHHAVFGDKYYPRRLYIPETGDFISADAQQIEYRIFAGLARNPKVLKAYQDNPQTSFHKLTFGMIAPFKSDHTYTQQKNLNFMRIYGGGLIKLAVMLGFITEADGEAIRAAKGQLSDPRLQRAREIEAIYNRELPEVTPLTKKYIHLAMPECNAYCKPDDDLHFRYQHQGYVTTLLGRRARFDKSGYKIHKALNAAIQGSAADIAKIKMVALYEARKALGLTLRFPVHDEINSDGPVESVPRIAEILNEQAIPLPVPILWSVGHGRTWADAK